MQSWNCQPTIYLNIFQPLEKEVTEKLAVYVEDGGRFDWVKDLPAAIDRMLSEKYAFMIAPQAMYLESRRHQIGIWHFYHPAFLEAKGKTCDIAEEGRKIKMSQDKKNVSWNG